VLGSRVPGAGVTFVRFRRAAGQRRYNLYDYTIGPHAGDQRPSGRSGRCAPSPAFAKSEKGPSVADTLVPCLPRARPRL